MADYLWKVKTEKIIIFSKGNVDYYFKFFPKKQ